jgi:hypothetical protein
LQWGGGFLLSRLDVARTVHWVRHVRHFRLFTEFGIAVAPKGFGAGSSTALCLECHYGQYHFVGGILLFFRSARSSPTHVSRQATDRYIDLSGIALCDTNCGLCGATALATQKLAATIAHGGAVFGRGVVLLVVCAVCARRRLELFIARLVAI